MCLSFISIDAMISFHINGNFSSTAASAIYETTIPCGVLEINKSGFLDKITEKPRSSYMVAAGLQPGKEGGRSVSSKINIPK